MLEIFRNIKEKFTAQKLNKPEPADETIFGRLLAQYDPKTPEDLAMVREEAVRLTKQKTS